MLPIKYLGVPWTIGRVIAECRTLNRANNGTNQFYVTSNNLKSKKIKTKSISVVKTISAKDSYWIISYFLNNKSIDLCIYFPNLVQTPRLCLDLRGRRNGSPTTTFMDPTKSFNPWLVTPRTVICWPLDWSKICSLITIHWPLRVTNRHSYGVMSTSIEEFRYDKDHDGKGPFRFQKSAQWALSMIRDS